MDLPNYRTLEKLGVGANSSIFHVQSLRNSQDYAVKYVKVHSPEDMKFVDQLQEEYNIGQAIDHPVIRKIFELRYIRRRMRVHGALLFMEYVNGVEMGAREFSVSIPLLLKYFVRAAEGLAAMHDTGYVHTDLKPGNLLVTPAGDVKIIDLGQSCKMMTAKPRVQGTIHYMAPEQANCGLLDKRTDVFGLGAALYRIITGKAVVTEMNRNIGMHAPGLIGMRKDKLDAAPEVEIPLCVSMLIDECCTKNPADRIQDMPTFMERAKLAIAILNKRDADAAKSGAASGKTLRR